MAMDDSKRPVAIDLFAGCGGLSLGLRQSGFRTLLFSELNASAASTYRVNHARLGDEPIHYADIRKLTNKRLQQHLNSWGKDGIKGVDLICGGPPCQGYSGIGHRRSYGVDRRDIPSNHLYGQMIRVIRKVRPRVFLFENVRGLMSGRWTKNGEKGEIWADVLKAFQRLERLPGRKSYFVRPTVVHAKDYGVPQNRPRVLIVGVRKDLGIDPKNDQDAILAGFLPGPVEEPAPDLWKVLGDLVDAEYPDTRETNFYLSKPATAYQQAMRALPEGGTLGKGEKLLEQAYSKHSGRVRARFTKLHQPNARVPIDLQTKKFAQRLLPRTWGKGGPNITVTSLPDDFVHYEQPRTLTVREWARLQGFPDWYEFRGPRTTGGLRRAGNPTEGNWDREVPKYTQIGNAVPVGLARVIGRHFRKLLSRAARIKAKNSR